MLQFPPHNDLVWNRETTEGQELGSGPDDWCKQTWILRYILICPTGGSLDLIIGQYFLNTFVFQCERKLDFCEELFSNTYNVLQLLFRASMHFALCGANLCTVLHIHLCPFSQTEIFCLLAHGDDLRTNVLKCGVEGSSGLNSLKS